MGGMSRVVAHELGRNAQDDVQYVLACEAGGHELVTICVRYSAPVRHNQRSKSVRRFQPGIGTLPAVTKRADGGRTHLLHLCNGSVSGQAVITLVFEFGRHPCLQHRVAAKATSLDRLKDGAVDGTLRSEPDPLEDLADDPSK